MSRGEGLIGYGDGGFVPLPNAVAVALAEHRLLRVDVSILVALYRRASRKTNRASVTLDRLAEWTGWCRGHDALSLGYLSERLRFLRSDGWLSYRSKPGANGHTYDVELHPIPIERRPERNPSRKQAENPSRREPGSRSGTGVGRAAETTLPEPPLPSVAVDSPSREGHNPSREQTGNRVMEPRTPLLDEAVTRAPKNGEEETNPSSKESFKDQRLGSSDHRTVDGTAETNDDALLAALGFETNGDGPAVALSENDREWIDGLVDEFDAVLVEAAPLCRYPSHRSSDWTNEGGRVVCGVCHPRAKGSAT